MTKHDISGQSATIDSATQATEGTMHQGSRNGMADAIKKWQEAKAKLDNLGPIDRQSIPVCW